MLRLVFLLFTFIATASACLSLLEFYESGHMLLYGSQSFGVVGAAQEREYTQAMNPTGRLGMYSGQIYGITRSYSYDYAVNFTVDGNNYQAIINGGKFHPGDKVIVYYDPNDPAHALANVPLQLWGDALIFLVLTIFAGGIGWICRPLKKVKSNAG